ncbi:MAG: hypothetical protein WA851_22625 [Xanthobacteraceae bacterium]
MTEVQPADQKQNGSLAAARMRRHRERRRDGLRCMNIELRATEIDALIDRGFLKPETRNDAKSIIEALYAFFDETLN